MDIRVLGTSRVLRQGEAGDLVAADLGARKPRGVLAALALHAGTDVSADLLVDVLWSGRPPAGAHGTLHSYLSGLRRALEPGLGPRERPSVVVTTDRGYRLAVDRTQVDAHRVAAEIRARHRALAPLESQVTAADPRGWPSEPDVVAHADALEVALGSWQGRPYDDLGDHEVVDAERTALEELRLIAEEARVLALLALGEHATVVAETEQMVARHPWRERAWALHVLALVRARRQADALAALRDVRQVLVEELGIDPGQELRDLEQAVLLQDPALQRWLRNGPAQSAPAPSTLSTPSTPARAVAAALPIVGRASERGTLESVLDDLGRGRPGCALLVGEPGIGKSRLLRHVADHAAAAGMVVAAGRCSQDDGAPPLWPWLAVLGDLRATATGEAGGLLQSAVDAVAATVSGGTPDDAAHGTTQAFRTFDTITRAVAAAARERPVLLTLEDLHWADTATLRVLRHLLDTAADAPVAVVATRRPWPEPRGALAEVGEAFGRRHGVRLELGGLSTGEAADLVSAVAGRHVPDAAALQWAERAGGNPFFLIELARLGDQVSDVPATVRDVLQRRLADLGAAARELLVTAAVLGRELSPEVLAAAADVPPEDLEDRLAPAFAAGLLRDAAAGRWGFTHALTREAVLDSTSPTRLARVHARVAHAYESSPAVAALVTPEERVAELARHWSAAGPTHVAHAWRAAAAAAEQVRRAFSHEEAAALMQAAVDAHRRDPAGTPEQRHGLLLTRARDCQRAADWRGVVDCAREAIGLARAAGDPVGVADAAVEITRNGLWMPHDWEVVLEDTVDDLRWALRALEGEAPDVRCRLMLSLAVELYYDPGAAAERAALVDEGLVLARRSADPALHWWATRAAWLASWRPEQATFRAALSAEGLALATEMDDPDAVAISHAVVSCDALELADLRAYRHHAAEAERIARRRRLTFVRYALAFVDLTLRTMADDAELAAARIEELRRLRMQIRLPAEELHEVGVILSSAYWTDDLEGLIEPMAAAVDSVPDTIGRETLYATLARTGRVAELRERMRTAPLLVTGGHWGTGNDAGMLAEVAATLRDPRSAAQARDLLAPLSGRMAVAGFSVCTGPVDGYLALTEAVTGDLTAAATHADRAEALAAEWDLPRYTAWLRSQRAAWGF